MKTEKRANLAEMKEQLEAYKQELEELSTAEDKAYEAGAGILLQYVDRNQLEADKGRLRILIAQLEQSILAFEMMNATFELQGVMTRPVNTFFSGLLNRWKF